MPTLLMTEKPKSLPLPNKPFPKIDFTYFAGKFIFTNFYKFQKKYGLMYKNKSTINLQNLDSHYVLVSFVGSTIGTFYSFCW